MVFILAVWLCVYPLVMLLTWVTGAAWPKAPLAARTALLTAILVPIIVLAVTPALKRILKSD